ncbi:MAG: class I SAM-dependent methyltransferase [Rhodomicrobium sp.]
MSNVSDTACWAALYRALESKRRDALFKDPFAERLAGEKGKEIAAHAPRLVRNGWPVIARTVLIDRYVQAAIAEGCDCVLNLAAGFDMRPYRLALPASLTWIEADLPALIEEKQSVLAGLKPSCLLTRQKADLANAAERAAFLDEALRRKSKALVISEGLLMYLSEDNVRSLSHDLMRPQVAWWVLETLSPMVREAIMKSMRSELTNAPMLFAPPDGIAFFERLGWKVLDVHSILHEALRLRRLPFLLSVAARLPLPQPDPRNVAKARWSAIVRLGR